MRRLSVILLALTAAILLLVLMLYLPNTVMAQTPTPTPSPTPSGIPDGYGFTAFGCTDQPGGAVMTINSEFDPGEIRGSWSTNANYGAVRCDAHLQWPTTINSFKIQAPDDWNNEYWQTCPATDAGIYTTASGFNRSRDGSIWTYTASGAGSSNFWLNIQEMRTCNSSTQGLVRGGSGIARLIEVNGVAIEELPPVCELDCIKTAVISEGSISPTDPQGVEIALTSGVTGTYLLEPQGGPWQNGGGPDLYDLAISEDRANWYPLLDFADTNCMTQTITGTLTMTNVVIETSADYLYIRVDDYNNFADNTGSMGYGLYATTCVLGSCGFALTDQLTAGSVPADLPSGDVIPAYIQPGNTYAIIINDPPWYDGDTTALSYAADMASTYPVSNPDWWHELPDFPGMVCTEDLGNGRLAGFFQAQTNTSPGFYSLRAHDPAADWLNNNGDVNYSIFNASYIAPLAECEANMAIMGWRNMGTIYANQETGTPVPIAGPLEPNMWFVLETSGGPWFDNNEGSPIPSYLTDMSQDGGQTWVMMDQWTADGQCYANPEYGKSRIYFQSQVGANYRIRVHDAPGDYGDNTGTMRYDMYFAWSFVPPTGESCSTMFQMGEEYGTGSIPANLVRGEVILDCPTPDTWFALEIIPPPFSVSPNPPIISADADMSASLDADPPNPTWQPLSDWSGAACAEYVDGNYPRVFFKTQTGTIYSLRAHDTIFGDNTGNVNYKLSYAIPSEEYPVPNSCEWEFTQGTWMGGGDIPANAEDGVMVISPVTDRWYKLETSGGPWLDNSVPHYDVEISKDGGQIWEPIETTSFIICEVTLNTNYVRVYFQGHSGDEYRIRVADDPGDFGDNTGSMHFALYSTAINPNAGPPPTIPPNWELFPYCYTGCTRPGSIVLITDLNLTIPDFAGWLEYGRCRLTQFLSWCPYHTAMLTSIPAKFYSRDPFGTLMEVKDTGGLIHEEFDAYDWSGDDEGGFEDIVNLLTTLPQSSPYVNGTIDIMPDSPPAYDLYCNSELEPVIGERLGAPVCFIFTVLDNLGVTGWWQFILDLSMLSIGFFYLYRKWLRRNG